MEDTDENPLATAWRELHEETTLTSESLCLFRHGKPYSFDDESIGRKWSINPFGFILKSAKEGGSGEAGIKLDWEHEGYEWFDPDAINESDSFEGVPRILESLRRVWFNIDLGEEAGKTLGEGLMALQRDHDSGAHQLASKALGIFIDVIQKIDTNSREVWWKNVRFAAWHLWKNGRESMGAPVLNAVLSSLGIIEGKLPNDTAISSETLNGMIQGLKEYEQQRHEASSRVRASFSTFLQQQYAGTGRLRILTLSCSSSVSSVLMDALGNGATLDIRVLESRPLFEGVKMAKTIASFADDKKIKVNISIYTDAGVGVAAQEADIVLLGADLIDEMANVSNKTGSLPAVLTAKHVSPKARVIVLADREKLLPFGATGQEENDAQEVVRAWGSITPSLNKDDVARIDVKNIYFEWVASDLIDHYIAEDGITSAAGITERAQEVRKKAERFFNDL